MKKSFLRSNNLIIVIASMLVFTISFDLISQDPILKRDDQGLISPLSNLSGLSDYIEKVKNNEILDVQPIRDISFLLNIWIHQFSGFSTFHLFNFILFVFCVFLFKRILEILNFSLVSINLSLLVFMFHPIMLSSYGWISARKHILGLLFLLMVIISVLRKNLEKKDYLFFALSVFSHQIFILTPIWFSLLSKFTEYKIKFKSILTLLSISIVALFLGYLKTFHLEMGNTTVTSFSLFENISRLVLSFGRSFIQMVFPISISGAYYQGNILGLIGVVTLTIFVFILYKNSVRKRSLAFFSLYPITFSLTGIAFVNDTYLYLPLITLIICLNLVGPKLIVLEKIKKYKWGLIAFPMLLLLKTGLSANMWKSDLNLWRHSYSDEGAPYAAILLGKNIMDQDEKLGIFFLHQGAKDYRLIEHLGILKYFVQNIYLTKTLDWSEKIAIFEECYIKHEIYDSYLSLAYLNGREKQRIKGETYLNKTLFPISKFPPYSEGYNVVKLLQNHCKDNYLAICYKLNEE